MTRLQDIVGMNDFVERYVRALDETAALGVRWKGTRFDQYLRLLKEAAALTYPRPFPWENEPQKRALFFEATSQAQQLVDASALWGENDVQVMQEKLGIITKGQAMPPPGTTAEDAPRNVLFELVTAASLRNKGFSVQLTAHNEDIVATYPRLKPFVVECKRPTHAGSLGNNLKKLRHQLIDLGMHSLRS